MKSILVLTCLCLTGVTRVSGTSKKVLDFLSFYSGIYDNERQTKEDGDDHDFVRFTLIPVDVKCLRPNPAVYLEEDVNNVTRIILLAVVKEDIEDTVSLTFYSLSDVNKDKRGQFKVENLSNISCGDLHEIKDCTASYRIMSDGVFGNLPYCSTTVNGQHPRFTCLVQCTSASSTTPLYVQERSPMEPYEFQLKSQKYPLINPPEDYLAPCGN